MSYAIEVQRTEAVLVDVRGGRLTAQVYVHTVSAHESRPETLADRVNDPETYFLPCQIEDTTELVNLDTLSYLEVPEGLPEIARLEEIGAQRAAVELLMLSGETLAGELLYEAPIQNPRVSELFNRHQRFLILVTPSSHYLVRTAAVGRVRLDNR